VWKGQALLVFGVGFSVGKNQMCLTVRWVSHLLVTFWGLASVAEIEVRSFNLATR